MTIKYLIGDATDPCEQGIKIIAHVCNDVGGFGSGFALCVKNKWPKVCNEYKGHHALKHFELGEVQFIDVSDSIIVANMIAQHGYSKPGRPAIRYAYLEDCLFKVARRAEDLKATIHMPKIASGLAGGKWNLIEPIIKNAMPNVEVFIYDFKG